MLRRKWESVFLYFSVLSDIVFLNGLFLIIYLVSNMGAGSPASGDLRVIWLFANVVYTLAYSVSGVYLQCTKSSLKHQLATTGRGSVYAGVFLLLFSILINPGKQFLFAISAFLPLQYFLASFSKRSLFHLNDWLRKNGYSLRNTLIVGHSPAIVQELQSCDISRFGYAIKGFMDTAQSDYYEFRDGALHAIKQGNLNEILDSLEIQKVLIVDDILEESRYDKIVETCCQKGIQAKLIPSQFDRIMQNLRVHDLVGILLGSPGCSKRSGP